MKYYALVDNGSDGPPWGLLRTDLSPTKFLVVLAIPSAPDWKDAPDALRFVTLGDDQSRADTLEPAQAQAFIDSWKQGAGVKKQEAPTEEEAWQEFLTSSPW